MNISFSFSPVKLLLSLLAVIKTALSDGFLNSKIPLYEFKLTSDSMKATVREKLQMELSSLSTESNNLQHTHMNFSSNNGYMNCLGQNNLKGPYVTYFTLPKKHISFFLLDF